VKAVIITTIIITNIYYYSGQ